MIRIGGPVKDLTVLKLQIFNQIMHNENNAISKSTIEKTIRRFEKINCVKNRPISERSILVTSKKKILRNHILTDA